MSGDSFDISSSEKEKLNRVLREILDRLRHNFRDAHSLNQVLVEGAHFTSSHTTSRQEPEEFTKRNIIEPLFEFLGYTTIPETRLPTPEGLRKPDYVISPPDGNPILYVEAEPINQNLYDKRHGVSQVQSWLISKAADTEYGIATNGFEWILLKFDAVNVRVKPILYINLQDIFKKLLNPHIFIEDEKIEEAKEKFLILHKDHILRFINEYSVKLEEEKEEISKKFYTDYVKYVFGLDEKGRPVEGINLLDSIRPPVGKTDHDKRLFAVILMNRLLFIKFLEEKGIVEKYLLRNLYEIYKESTPIESFYRVYLRPLFYYVFNKSPDNRPSHVKENDFYGSIPYLNGGLFREILPMEKEYDVSNEGIELVIEQLLERYSFGLGVDSKINPDILGYVFEKTINYISRTGTNEQKMKGAYYTPDDVVSFIIKHTLEPVIYEKMIEAMREVGWKEPDLAHMKTLNDVLRYLTSKNAPTIEKILEKINEIKVLDPAVGSGHFLTAALSVILRVKISLLDLITPKDEDIDRYHLKKEIITHNLFGVDIDEHAVEIARLRLWLSLIEDVSNVEHIDTLPNVDFNIISGNSLIGWVDEKLTTHPLENLAEDEYVKGVLEALRLSYEKEIDEIEELFNRMSLSDTIRAYQKLVSIYSKESGDKAIKIRNILENVRKKLYNIINSSFIDYIASHTNIHPDEIKLNIPFHWKIDFRNVLDKGGFDVVVGNPPYIEDRNYSKDDKKIIKSVVVERKGKKKIKTDIPLFYESKDCGNTHAYFIERSIKLLRNGGRFGFIVPIALVSTPRMGAVRKVILSKSSYVAYYNFDDRPGKIFSGLEHCRSTIVITRKGESTDKVITSKYHRWYTRNRPDLFKNLLTVEWEIRDAKELIPKIGTELEKDILDKLHDKASGKHLGDFIVEDGERVWYHNAPQYWIHAHTDEYLPKAEYYDNWKEEKSDGRNVIVPIGKPTDIRITDQYKKIIINKKDVYVVLTLLNASLFYWWFILWSDGRHLLDNHIKTSPIDLDNFPNELRDRLKGLGKKLMDDYEKNSVIRYNKRSGGYVIKIKEIHPKHSKSIIDDIDDIFAEYYGFTDEEKEFIKNFDITFRMSDALE